MNRSRAEIQRLTAIFETLEARRLVSVTPLPNIQVTTNSDVQQQPSIAVDPHSSKHLVIAYMDRSLVSSGYAGIGVSVSNDVGKTWTQSHITLPTGFDQSAANPVARFDDHGHVFVSFMATTFLGGKPPYNNPSGSDPVTHDSNTNFGFTANNGIFVARSDDGGLTWNDPVKVAANLYDGKTQVPFERIPDMATDNGAASPYNGNIYVAWSRYYPPGKFPGEPGSTGGSQLEIAVSSDGGQSFQLRPHIHDTFDSGTGPPEGFGAANWPHLTIGPQGFVYAAFFDFSSFTVLHSEDAAKTFDPDSAAALEQHKHSVFDDLASLGSTDDSLAGGALAKLPGFRTQVTRSIVADPLHPGRVYATESVAVYDKLGAEQDADIFFARSDNNSLTWKTLKVNGENGAVNDDNFGKLFSGQDSDVHGRQFFARSAIDDQGRLIVEWYDTRRDPQGMKLDVFAAISTDGGQSFGPNFHVTDHPFDVAAGKFTDALGQNDYYLGDFVGLATADDVAFAAWDDTRNGNQDIYFASFGISDPPAPENDRFEPNNDPASATNLGPLIKTLVPKLHTGPGDADWFALQTPATGTLDIEASQSQSGQRLRVDLFDQAGATLLGSGVPILDGSGRVVGQHLRIGSKTGQHFLLRVSSTAGASTLYSLNIHALTKDLGTVAHHVIDRTLPAGAQNYFLLSAAASGSVRLKLSPGADAKGEFALDILDPQTQQVLSTAASAGIVTFAVDKDQALLIRVAGKTALSAGSYSLECTNFDSYAMADRDGLLFPSGPGPSTIQTGDLNGDGKDDLIIGDGFSNTVSVLLSNGDGTFQAPREFGVGPFHAGILGPLIPTFRRDLVLADFNGDHKLDLAVCNPSSADVSILLGRGDGTFQPQRRFDAATLPFGIDAGDLNGDGITDLAVINVAAGPLELAVLIGRGDGTFRSAVFVPTNAEGSGVGAIASDVKIGDINRDGFADLVYSGSLDGRTRVRLGTGDGHTFKSILTHAGKEETFDGTGPSFQLTDLNGDGNLDLANANLFVNTVSLAFGNGDGTFGNSESIYAGTSPVDTAVADVGSAKSDGTLGPPDGIPDVITAASGFSQVSFFGPGEITVSPGMKGKDGSVSYGDSIHLADAIQPLGVALGDFTGHGKVEIAFTDTDGIRTVFNDSAEIPANVSLHSARDLGTLVHLLQQTLTIVPGREQAWYSLTVPTEAKGDFDEVTDFLGGFQHLDGAGLQMEILDARGRVLGSGEHLRLAAKQGERLYVHIFGKSDSSGAAGSGAYTLDIDMLPQVISVQGQPLLPGADGGVGGATASLVLTFQGDRLDPIAAQDAANYTVTWLGPDGILGSADDRVIPVNAGSAQSVVYNPSANVDVVSGLTYPTAVRQTVTLLFKDPLPAGSYRVEVQPKVVAAAFNQSENSSGHPVATLRHGRVGEGADVIAKNAVSSIDAAVSFANFASGTPFLSQLQSDLGALLDQNLTAGEEKTVTDELIAQLQARLASGLAGAAATTSFLGLFLDPVSLDIEDPTGAHASYNLTSGHFANGISNAFVAVASNVELVIIPAASGKFMLNVDDVPSTARGGAVLFGRDGVETVALTDGLRDGTRSFVLNIDAPDADPFPINPILGQLGFGRAVFASLTGLLLNSGIDSSRVPQATPASSVNAPFTASVQAKVKRPAPRPTRSRSTVAPWMQLKGVFTSVGEAMQTYLMKLMKQLNKEKSVPAKPGEIDQPLDNSDEKMGEKQSGAPADRNSSTPAASKTRPAEQQDRHSRAGRAWPWIVLSAFAGLRFAGAVSARHSNPRRSRRSRRRTRKGGQS